MAWSDAPRHSNQALLAAALFFAAGLYGLWSDNAATPALVFLALGILWVAIALDSRHRDPGGEGGRADGA